MNEARPRRERPHSWVPDTFGGKVLRLRVADEARDVRRRAHGRSPWQVHEGRSAGGLQRVSAATGSTKLVEQVSKEYPGEDMQRFLDDYDFNPAGGGESVNEVQARAK